MGMGETCAGCNRLDGHPGECGDPYADQVAVVGTWDEAVAVAVSEVEDGGEVVIHDATCATGTANARLDDCDCAPMVHVVRTGAA